MDWKLGACYKRGVSFPMTQLLEARPNQDVGMPPFVNGDKPPRLDQLPLQVPAVQPVGAILFEREATDNLCGLNETIFPVDSIRELTAGKFTMDHYRVLRRIQSHNFREAVWTVESSHDMEDAAKYVAMGGRVFHPFGNILALTGHPHDAAVQHTNIVKGRPAKKTGSVTTAPEHFADVFDIHHPLMPPELQGETFTELMRELYRGIGPFGVRGPASEAILRNYKMMIQQDGPIVQTQLIAVGLDCPSHELLRQATQFRIAMGENPDLAKIFFITSANLSSALTGEEEPAHWYSRHAAQEFHSLGIPILGYETPELEEEIFTRRYGHLVPSSTTIISLHKVSRRENAPPALVIERYGSAEPALVKDIVAPYGFDIEIAPTAEQRLQTRIY